MNLRFGLPTRSNPLGELILVRRTRTVAEYQDRLLTFLARCDGVTELQHVSIFTAGFAPPLQVDVELQSSVSLEDAMSLARSFERRLITDDATVAGCVRRPCRPQLAP